MSITATTITAAITASQTSVALASVTGVTAPNNQTGVGITYLFIDQELFLVTGAPVGLVVPVVRAQNGTLAQAHVVNSQVQIGIPGDFVPQNEVLGTAIAGVQTIGGLNLPAVFLAGSTDAIPNSVPGNYVVKTAGVNAMTLAAPPASAEGNVISIFSDTTNAHTITATTLFANGTALKTTATFPAFRGAGVILKAVNGVWHVLSNASAGQVVFS